MEYSKIRTRFAPSPTGYMHVGNLRTALYAYLISKHEDGDFILRIEDTDQERYVEGAVDIINNTLKATGLIHDEGPDLGGDYGPYVQSERKGIYLQYAKELVDKGEAYYCFCDKDRLENLRKDLESKNETFRYDKHCLHLSKEEIQENIEKGIPYVIRQNNPVEGTTSFEDVIYGHISVDNSELEDMILIKSDGLPTYNFANVVDDHLMKITHVVRGSEYLSSSPKYNRLYDAFGWEVPVYVHCPPIMKDAHNKLSKRNGDASFQDLVAKGYLKEAVLNYIALLGWNPGGNEEIFSLEDLVKIFDYKNINKSPAIFDSQKLKWMNGEYIKRLPLDTFHDLALPYYEGILPKEMDSKKVSELMQTRVEVLSEIPEKIGFFAELPEYSIEIFLHKKMKTTIENSLENLTKILPALEALEPWNSDTISGLISEFVSKEGIKNGQIMWPIRSALSGLQSSPGGYLELADILGKDESISRIKIAINNLQSHL
ncbi:glutamyl-tRNA synthetase [Clostridium amylolyticum]|uniref:Glutamate--tRNA ligase n=1 Tax=Clostridium amylolyticum TaxID=1121298 RepID=A0A1M6KTK2_9CLOT|nr:glutamate--tRNA ligase [Clostridium amylolyticum]SHJ62311.1 glutamyl-tRNA synthetase [Clostridium amylolyticum]